jgi:hypothetical protein
VVTQQRTPLATPAPATRGRAWLVPLAIYLLARCASGVLVLLLGHDQQSAFAPDDLQVRLAQDPATYLNLLSNWDGQWYLQIAAHGYPGALPIVDGAVVENVWAFFPVFPGIVGLLGQLGLPLPLAATLVSTACGGAAMVLLHAMLRPTTGRFTAALTVAAFSFGPASLVLQASYTESLALLEILLVLVALRHQRYAYAALVVAVLAFTRPMALPVAAVIGVTWLLRLRHRHEEPFPRREMLAHAALALGTAASFVVWPLVCSFVTGQPNAYAETQKAWLDDRTGWQTWLSPIVTGDEPGLLVLALPVLLLLTWVACRRAARVWGPELQSWAVLYPLFILAVSRPTTSIFRYLMLTTVSAWPFPDLSSRVRSPGARVALLASVMCLGLLTQYCWISWFWVITDESILGIP